MFNQSLSFQNASALYAALVVLWAEEPSGLERCDRHHAETWRVLHMLGIRLNSWMLRGPRWRRSSAEAHACRGRLLLIVRSTASAWSLGLGLEGAEAAAPTHVETTMQEFFRVSEWT